MANRYAVVEEATNIVDNTIVWDGEAEYDPGDGMFLVPSDSASIGWSYVSGEFVAPPEPELPPPSPEEILAANTGVRDSLLTSATLAIAPLQDAVDLDMATEAEVAALKKWKQYRVAVNRVVLTESNPTWPTTPV